jgi:hypothetical protein
VIRNFLSGQYSNALRVIAFNTARAGRGTYRVQDATGHPLGYFYSWDDPAAAHQTGVLTRVEAKSMAEGFARLSKSAPRDS